MATCEIFPSERLGHDDCTRLLQPEVQQYVKDVFWPQSKSSTAEFASYFKYVQWTLSMLSWPDGIVDSNQFAARTYGDLAKITRWLELNTNCSRLAIAEKLREDFPYCTQAQILRSVDLTVRLWLTLYVRSEDFPLGPSLSDITEVRWHQKISLKTMIEETLPTGSYAAMNQRTSIDSSFTAKNLRKICRITIHWTANLKDHLSYERSTSTLRLFPHKICLISHLESTDVLPKGLVAETLRTLDLLFPFSKESTQKYLDETGQQFYRTSSPDLSRATDFREFRYWRKRLVELQDVYQEAPKGVIQMWYDRRNPMQWWTFWLAAAIALLTVVFGIINAYTGFRQVALTKKANQLSILQICSQTRVPDVCKK